MHNAHYRFFPGWSVADDNPSIVMYHNEAKCGVIRMKRSVVNDDSRHIRTKHPPMLYSSLHWHLANLADPDLRQLLHCCPIVASPIKTLRQTFLWSYSILNSPFLPAVCPPVSHVLYLIILQNSVSHISQVTQFSSPQAGVLLRAAENLKVDLWTRAWHPAITLQPPALIDFDVSGEQRGPVVPIQNPEDKLLKTTQSIANIHQGWS